MMIRTHQIGLGLGLAALVAIATTSARADELEVGDEAPDFTLRASDGQTYSLSDFKGKKPVVIAWFPKAFTGGCTKQCRSMAEQGDQIKRFDVAYFTASTDDVETNQKFAESLHVDYPILSDPGGKVAEAYGVLMADRGLARRVTFYIDKEGIIRGIDKQIVTENAGAEVAEMLEELEIASKN